jgi:hypothetical protein
LEGKQSTAEEKVKPVHGVEVGFDFQVGDGKFQSFLLKFLDDQVRFALLSELEASHLCF